MPFAVLLFTFLCMDHIKLETDLSVKAEINLYYDLLLPENFAGNAPLLIAVHGYGAHKRYMMREAQLVAPENFVVASLQAPHQHYRETENGYKIGFGWLTDYKSEESILTHHNFVLEVIEKLVGSGAVDAEKVYFFGFSQACALNFRFAFTFPEILRGVVAVCGGIPSDLDENPVYQATGANVFYLHSKKDEFYSWEKYENFARKLDEFLPNFKSKLYDAGHEITDEMREDIKVWLKTN